MAPVTEKQQAALTSASARRTAIATAHDLGELIERVDLNADPVGWRLVVLQITLVAEDLDRRLDAEEAS